MQHLVTEHSKSQFNKAILQVFNFLIYQSDMLGLHITDSHVPRDHLHTQDPGPSPSMSVETTPELLDMDVGDLRGDVAQMGSVDHVETTPELLDVDVGDLRGDVAQMGSVDHVETTPELLDVDVGDLRGDVAQMGPVYTYEDAGPSTKRLTPPRKRVRAFTQFLAMLFIRF